MKRLLIACLAAVCLIVPTAAQDQEQIIDLSGNAARVSRASSANRLTGPSTANRPDVVSDFLAARHGHDQATSRSVVVEAENPTDDGPVHMRMRQRVGGLDVYGTYVKATLTSAGELVSVIENLAPVRAPLPAQVDYRDALETALERHYPGQPTDLPEAASAENRVSFARGARFYEDPAVTRVIVPLNGGRMRVGYLVETWDHANQLWHTVVNGNGRIVFEELRTASDSYNVFVNQPNRTPQAIVAGPGAGNATSPIGWVTANTTTGNNVDAYLDRDNNGSADTGGRPTGTGAGGKDFLTAADLAQAPTTTANQMVAVTNLFYLNNVIHDTLYRHGFNEAAGNFQTDNFGNGGAGLDSVRAEAQDGGGLNNANFSTPLDGSRPRMQMYLWNTATPQRDGDVDSDIVYHEYGHGLTWRMIGSMSGPLAGAIGEGQGDTLALYMNGDDLMAEYSTNNSSRGIRRFRYEAYPNTYGDVTGGSVHSDGEIYAATMWRLRQLWVGSSRDIDQLWTYMIDGMNYTPSAPAYEDMRDGILSSMVTRAATQADQCVVWQAFAQFGIGVGADGRTFPTLSVTESFAQPAACSAPQNTAPTVNITAPANNSSFTQGNGVTFTGTASDAQEPGISGANIVWKEGSTVLATGATFTKSDFAVGQHTIVASVTDSGNLTGSASVTINITSTQPPTITLTTRPYKIKGVRHVDLTWSGATTAVDIYRNNVTIFTNSPNDGFQTDPVGGKGGGSFSYRVCLTGTQTCSATVPAVF